MRTVGDALRAKLPHPEAFETYYLNDATLHYVVDALRNLGVWDATVIEPPEPGGPVYVVTGEALTAGVDALYAGVFEGHEGPDAGIERAAFEQALRDALAVLLGNVRVAKAVGRIEPLGCSDVLVTADDKCFDFEDGDTVAALEDE